MKLKQWLAVLASIIILVAVVIYNQNAIKEHASTKVLPKVKKETLRDVKVLHVTSGSYRAEVTLYGEVQPHYTLVLKPQVSGEIVSLNKRFEMGEQVKASQELLHIDPIDYQTALADAQAIFAQAQLAYKQEQKESERARAEWNASGFTGEADALVLRIPQLEAAKATLQKAEYALAGAARNLRNSSVVAPFDALVVTRNVALGESIQNTTELATLYSTDRVEITAALSQREWSMLPELKQMQSDAFEVTLEGIESGYVYQGRVLREHGYLDTATRQRGIIIGVNKPFDFEHPLYPGTFVIATLKGRMVQDIWRLPVSALSQESKIWYVENNVLHAFDAEPLFSDERAIYIRPPDALHLKSVAVLLHPLSGYVEGMKVHAIEADHE